MSEAFSGAEGLAESTPVTRPGTGTGTGTGTVTGGRAAAEGACWDTVRERLLRHGSALVHGTLGEWRPEEQDSPGLRALLGRDWGRYTDLADPGPRAGYAASRRLLKYAAGAVLGAHPEELELAYGPTGRPYLRGCDQLDLSLSHTEDLLLVGLTTRGLIGVDAERTDRAMYAKGLGKHLCTPKELKELAALPEESRNPVLVRLWTLKEAYSKALGQGMQFRFTEFGFGTDRGPTRVLRPDGTPATGDEWRFDTLGLTAQGTNYRVSAAVYDSGLGPGPDIGISTMLDGEAMDAVFRALDVEVEADAYADVEASARPRKPGR
ncbi:4'-phosphopantetheinyl transferase superfamily protein [Streptomyces sp. NA04227]|uniref:4'-phosphopantetheinyl transferase family protein n=1 Tax=Streptomyces sp. NA04227 TaxID=2742136 RepID=UPI0015924248|nr:4'-phosphopantetheinyl transferase superfamily protein [Streptomyces sp. NA04227]QKW05089.1 4'-phosphopantetheinyl transferase superfamily protein [Streptomyces sp. NA04227]